MDEILNHIGVQWIIMLFKSMLSQLWRNKLGQSGSTLVHQLNLTILNISHASYKCETTHILEQQRKYINLSV
jgi:hypothetical protein